VKTDRVEPSPHAKSLEDDINKTADKSTEHLTDANKDTVPADITAPATSQTDESGNDIDDAKAVPITDNSDIETRNSSTDDDTTVSNPESVPESSSRAVAGKEVDSINGNHPAETNSKTSSANEDVSLKVHQVRPESEIAEAPSIIHGQESESGPQPEPSPCENKQQEIKTEKLPKIQDQLDEVNFTFYKKNSHLGILLFVLLDVLQFSLLIPQSWLAGSGTAKECSFYW